jgi:hypothetical protein
LAIVRWCCNGPSQAFLPLWLPGAKWAWCSPYCRTVRLGVTPTPCCEAFRQRCGQRRMRARQHVGWPIPRGCSGYVTRHGERAHRLACRHALTAATRRPDCRGHCTDRAEPALAEGRVKMRLANDRRGSPGPILIVELEPERDVKGETDRGPHRRAAARRTPSPHSPKPPAIEAQEPDQGSARACRRRGSLSEVPVCTAAKHVVVVT